MFFKILWLLIVLGVNLSYQFPQVSVETRIDKVEFKIDKNANETLLDLTRKSTTINQTTGYHKQQDNFDNENQGRS